MISVTDEMYAQLAARLFDELKTSGNFFNGRIGCDTPDYASVLTCSAVVYRSQVTGSESFDSPVVKVVPVWWDFSIATSAGPREHDFSWSEFTQFFSYA